MANPLERFPAVEILDASPDDASEIALLQKETWLATYPDETRGITEADIASHFSNTEERVKRWKENIERQTDQHVWTAKIDGKTVGFCSAERKSGANQIKAIYVLPEYQKGEIGTQLLEKALDWAGGDTTVAVEVASYNEPAIKFYEKYGFSREISEAPPYEVQLPNGKTIPSIRMTKVPRKK